MYKVKIVNQYFVKEMLKNKRFIDANNFYKPDLIEIINIIQNEYIKLQDEKDKLQTELNTVKATMLSLQNEGKKE